MATHLQVILRVPVRVEDDTGVGRSQVDSESSGTSTQKEDKAVRVRARKPINSSLAQIPSHSAIDTLIWIPATHTQL